MMGSTSGLNRQLIATGHGDDQWMDWGPDGPPFLGRMTNPKSTPKSGRGYAGDIFGSEVVPFFVPTVVVSEDSKWSETPCFFCSGTSTGHHFGGWSVPADFRAISSAFFENCFFITSILWFFMWSIIIPIQMATAMWVGDSTDPDGPWAQGPRDISDGLRPTKRPGAVPGISTAQPGRSHSATVSGVIASI